MTWLATIALAVQLPPAKWPERTTWENTGHRSYEAYSAPSDTDEVRVMARCLFGDLEAAIQFRHRAPEAPRVLSVTWDGAETDRYRLGRVPGLRRYLWGPALGSETLRFVDELATRNQLTINIEDRAHTVSLTGSAAAIARIGACRR